jgi:hypothetical protein
MIELTIAENTPTIVRIRRRIKITGAMRWEKNIGILSVSASPNPIDKEEDVEEECKHPRAGDE